MSYSTTYAIDNGTQSGSPAGYPVKANTFCNRISVQENYDSANPPSADLNKYEPWGSTTAVLRSKGVNVVFTPEKGAAYVPNQIVGQIQTVSGSITVQQEESMQV